MRSRNSRKALSLKRNLATSGRFSWNGTMNALWQWQWIGILTARLAVGLMFAISGCPSPKFLLLVLWLPLNS
jgi:hypothetical protein